MTATELSFFKEILSIDSTTGSERALSDFLADHFMSMGAGAVLRRFEVGDGSENLLLSWGEPKVVFCTHMDTVPPYIPPTFVSAAEAAWRAEMSAVAVAAAGAAAAGEAPSGRVPEASTPCKASGALPEGAAAQADEVLPEGAAAQADEEDAVIYGRGACDAKGQIVAMLKACLKLSDEGKSGFALLLLSGEETGSWGAKAFAKLPFEAPFLIVGEPTGGIPVSASKGTKSFDLSFRGIPFHSGYPEKGLSAVDLFIDFCNRLREVDFGDDPILGKTSWNIGLLRSDNPQNILSAELSCRIYFRTTFLSDGKVEAVLKEIAGLTVSDRADGAAAGRVPEASTPCKVSGAQPAEASPGIDISARGGDAPAKYVVPDGFPSKPAAFGSDAPHLKNFPHKIICGPGSILTAHRDDEQITTTEIDSAAASYIRMYNCLTAS
ncbi:MAG: M20/M25/M40 family metallo-hydrolase [Bacteroidales bacterium]|nr:M20/M25/M40 family metallo-hydrolase [Bacteroidales bacterium]